MGWSLEHDSLKWIPVQAPVVLYMYENKPVHPVQMSPFEADRPSTTVGDISILPKMYALPKMRAKPENTRFIGFDEK